MDVTALDRTEDLSAYSHETEKRAPLEALIAPAACATCSAEPEGAANSVEPGFIYALGQVEARFPRLSLEKEYAQAAARIDARGLTDRQVFHAVLSSREGRYLARQLCWILTVQGLDTYILVPRDPADLDLFISLLEPQPQPWITAVIGLRGPMSAPGHCNGLVAPIVVVDQLYSFDRPSLIQAIPKPASFSDDSFSAAAEELFDRVIQLADNAGATDEHRALNYLTMRYSAVYAQVAEQFAENFSLDGVFATPSRLSGLRNVIDVIFSFTERSVGYTKKYFVRVDVTEEFPFLVTKFSPYYDR